MHVCSPLSPPLVPPAAFIVLLAVLRRELPVLQQDCQEVLKIKQVRQHTHAGMGGRPQCNTDTCPPTGQLVASPQRPTRSPCRLPCGVAFDMPAGTRLPA